MVPEKFKARSYALHPPGCFLSCFSFILRYSAGGKPTINKKIIGSINTSPERPLLGIQALHNTTLHRNSLCIAGAKGYVKELHQWSRSVRPQNPLAGLIYAFAIDELSFTPMRCATTVGRAVSFILCTRSLPFLLITPGSNPPSADRRQLTIDATTHCCTL